MVSTARDARRLFLIPLTLALAASAPADISNVIFHLDVTDGVSSATFEAYESQLVPDPGIGGWKWTLPAAEELWDWNTGTLLGTLSGATVRLVENPAGIPRIIMNFNIEASSVDATWVIDSAIVSFPSPLPGYLTQGRATAAFTLTDTNDGVPAVLQGLNPNSGTGIFEAQYNGFPNGVVFANLVNELSVDGGGTVSANQAVPPVGTWEWIGVDIYDIAFRNAFTLTALDEMSGQTAFYVIPEPVSLMLLTLAAFAIRRR